MSKENQVRRYGGKFGDVPEAVPETAAELCKCGEPKLPDRAQCGACYRAQYAAVWRFRDSVVESVEAWGARLRAEGRWPEHLPVPRDPREDRSPWTPTADQRERLRQIAAMWRRYNSQGDADE